VTTSEQAPVQTPTEAVQPSGVNHLVLNVKDLERSHRFWTEIIGFKQVGQSRPESPFQMRFYAGSDGSRHHDLALAQIADPEQVPDPAEPWSMRGRAPGVNHVAIKYPDRESWLRQLAFLQSKGVTFHSRVEHGMTHSVYISDPDGHGIEVLYELPQEVWEDDIAAALIWARRLPTEGPEALEDSTDYTVFGKEQSG
jgi:catechol 2,3-dioxygenase-like lactoylglutathione lyase family enzyme